MTSGINSAIGTQRQFKKQPEATYESRLQSPMFGRNIAERDDVSARALANSLGVLGEAIWQEDVAEDRRKREQLTSDAADRLIAGKTPEDLSKLNHIALLQGADSPYDLSDNPYAIAALDKSIGQSAAVGAKAQYFYDNQGKVPNSVQEAVKSYSDYMEGAYNKQSGNARNSAAFDKGFYRTFISDTMNVAENARKTIDDNMRATGMLRVSKKAETLAAQAPGMSLEDMVTNAQGIFNESKLYTRNLGESATFAKAVLTDISKHANNASVLNALQNLEYAPGHKIKDEILMADMYTNITKQINSNLSDEAIKYATAADGSFDEAKAIDYITKKWTESKTKFANGLTNNLPSVPIQFNNDTVRGEVDNLKAELKNAVPFIGGLLHNLGIKNPIITSGARSKEYNAGLSGSGENSYHIYGDALDIDLGDVSVDEGKAVAAQFAPYFKEAMYHNGTGWHLHLGGYMGGLEGSSEVDDMASAYNPKGLEQMLNVIQAHGADVRRLQKEKKAKELEDFSRSVDGAGSLSEALSMIQGNSGMSNGDKLRMINTYKALWKAKGDDTVDGTVKHWLTYRDGSMYKDLDTINKYYNLIATGGDVGTEDKENSPLSQYKKAQGRIARCKEALGEYFVGRYAEEYKQTERLEPYRQVWGALEDMIGKGASRAEIESAVQKYAPQYGYKPEDFLANFPWERLKEKKADKRGWLERTYGMKF